MRGATQVIGVLALLAVVGIAYGIASGVIHIPGLFATSQPTVCVLQTDYNYIGCVEDPANKPVLYIGGANAWYKCPTVTSTITGCTLLSNGPIYGCAAGSNGCDGFFKPWTRTIDTGNYINPGEWVYAGNRNLNSVAIRENYIALTSCGTNIATCATGAITPVLGALFCKFNTNDKIYNADGSIAANANKQAAFAYTVPFGRTYAYAANSHCIYVPTCNTDADCSTYGQYNGIYNGQSVGYSISNLMVSVYGCQPNSLMTVGADVIAGVKNLSTQQVSVGKCTVKTSFQIQCQPGSSSCGANSFCQDMGNLDFRCKSTAQCTTNYDCGTQVVCDGSTRKLKTPQCLGGQCSFSEQSVQCCDYYNCADGYYCDANHQCKEGGQTKVPCPNQCCQSSATYFDKPCAIGQECCADGTCAGTGATRQTCASGGGQNTCTNCGWDISCILGCWWAAYGWIVILFAMLIVALLVLIAIIAVAL